MNRERVGDPGAKGVDKVRGLVYLIEYPIAYRIPYRILSRKTTYVYFTEYPVECPIDYSKTSL